nr:hypothetical protein [Tanacetum cinerariifolium]
MERGFSSQKRSGVGRGVKEKQSLMADKSVKVSKHVNEVLGSNSTTRTPNVVNVGLESFPTVSEAHGIHAPISANEENIHYVGNGVDVVSWSLLKLLVNSLLIRHMDKSSYARPLIDIQAYVELKDNIMVAMAKLMMRDIYDDPSLLRFYQNNDVPPWETQKEKWKEKMVPIGSLGVNLRIISQLYDRKNLHLKGLGEMLHKKRNDMHKQFSQILSTLESRIQTSHLKKLTLAITTRSGTTTCDPPYLSAPTSSAIYETTKVERPEARAMIDVHEGKLSLRVGSETVTFNIGKSTKSTNSRDDYLYCANHIIKLVKEQWVDTIYHDGEWVNTNDNAPKNRPKPSISKPPELELKELPEHLEGAKKLAADHLSRLENLELGKPTKAETRDLSPEEQLMSITNQSNEPWHAYYANYLASRVLPF